VTAKKGTSTGPSPLDALATHDAYRTGLALAAAALTFLAAQPLLLFYPGVQLALACGVVAGLVAGSDIGAALSAGGAVVLGELLGLPVMWDLTIPRTPPWQAAVFGLLAAAVAFGVRWGARKSSLAARGALWLVVAGFSANLWVTVLAVAGKRATDYRLGGQVVPTLWEQLRGQMPAAVVDDKTIFLDAVLRMRHGSGFYSAFSAAMADAKFPVSNVYNYRLPPIFWLWAALPSLTWVVPIFLALGTAAVLSLPLAYRGLVKQPLVIPAAGALASYLAIFAVQLEVVSAEPWAAVLAVLAFLAYVASFRSQRWRALTIAAVALALASALTRELAALLLLAGLISAVWQSDQRRFRTVAWGAGLGAFALAYAAHAARVMPLLQRSGGAMTTAPGLGNAVLALQYGWLLAAVAPWVPWLLVALGMFGAIAISPRELKTFSIAAIALPLVVFSLVSNNATGMLGAAENYWGTLVNPLIIACIPAAWLLLPRTGGAPAKSTTRDERRSK
jgi:hypothetical protein